MDVIFLINSLCGGGAEAVLTRLSEKLSINRIILIERDVKYKINQERLTFLSKHTIKTNPFLKTLLISEYSRRLSKYLNKNSVVVSFLERANFVNVFTKKFSKHTSIISVHMDQIEGHRGLRKLNLFLIKYFYPKANLVVAVSQGVKESLIKLGVKDEKIKVIYNPYPIEDIRKILVEEIEDIFEKFPYIITVGRLTQAKGQWYLIRVFRKLKEIFPELKLLILGEGELKEYLVSLSENLELKTFVWDRDKLLETFDVYFMGFQKNPFKYIAKAKLLVAPSLWEGFSNTLLDAMACGIPIVSSDCRSGPREILAPDTDFKKVAEDIEFAKYGVLVPPLEIRYKKADESMDEKERILYKALYELLNNRKLHNEYSKKVVERAKDFDINRIAESWLELLKC